MTREGRCSKPGTGSSAALRLLAAALLAAVLQGCASLPSNDGRVASTAVTDTAGTELGQVVVPLVEAHPGQSGFRSLLEPEDSFAARLMLARAAERSLDLQYYIWRRDLTGSLLFDALRAAADRGVRVRLLLDDNNTAGLDPLLAALAAHPHIEVRLFNPFQFRQERALDFLIDFARLNRRMHNKSFTADNQATIVGGRNIGDEYFGAGNGVLFSDLDVLAVGPVVRDVSRNFDRYWASAAAYPAQRLLAPADPELLAGLARQVAHPEDDPEAAPFAEAIYRSAFVDSLVHGDLGLQWGRAILLSDDPDKGLGRVDRSDWMFWKLAPIIGGAAREVQIVSPYFVPTATGTDALVALARRGVKVQLLTNSLEATDVTAVHAGYAKHRRALLEAGISLFELKRSAVDPAPRRRLGLRGLSAASLHAKTFAVDRSKVFVGSFNFDPRSAELNTEMGVVIDTPVLAGNLAEAFEGRIPLRSYRVALTDGGQLEWIEQRDGRTLIHRDEPGVGFWLKAWVWLLSLLPIEWLL